MLHSNVFSNGKWVYVSDFAKTLDLLKNVLYRLVVSVIFCQLTRASLFVRWQKITLTTRLYKTFVNRSRVCKIWYVHPFSITKDIGMQHASLVSFWLNDLNSKIRLYNSPETAWIFFSFNAKAFLTSQTECPSLVITPAPSFSFIIKHATLRNQRCQTQTNYAWVFFNRVTSARTTLRARRTRSLTLWQL